MLNKHKQFRRLSIYNRAMTFQNINLIINTDLCRCSRASLAGKYPLLVWRFTVFQPDRMARADIISTILSFKFYSNQSYTSAQSNCFKSFAMKNISPLPFLSTSLAPPTPRGDHFQLWLFGYLFPCQYVCKECWNLYFSLVIFFFNFNHYILTIIFWGFLCSLPLPAPQCGCGIILARSAFGVNINQTVWKPSM